MRGGGSGGGNMGLHPLLCFLKYLFCLQEIEPDICYLKAKECKFLIIFSLYIIYFWSIVKEIIQVILITLDASFLMYSNATMV